MSGSNWRKHGATLQSLRVNAAINVTWLKRQVAPAARVSVTFMSGVVCSPQDGVLFLQTWCLFWCTCWDLFCWCIVSQKPHYIDAHPCNPSPHTLHRHSFPCSRSGICIRVIPMKYKMYTCRYRSSFLQPPYPTPTLLPVLKVGSLNPSRDKPMTYKMYTCRYWASFLHPPLLYPDTTSRAEGQEFESQSNQTNDI